MVGMMIFLYLVLVILFFVITISFKMLETIVEKFVEIFIETVILVLFFIVLFIVFNSISELLGAKSFIEVLGSVLMIGLAIALLAIPGGLMIYFGTLLLALSMGIAEVIRKCFEFLGRKTQNIMEYFLGKVQLQIEALDIDIDIDMDKDEYGRDKGGNTAGISH